MLNVFNTDKTFQVKVSNKSASQKPKKQKKIRTNSSSQPQSDQGKCKGEPSLKKFLYSAPDSKYEILHNKSPTEETAAFKSSQPEQSVENTHVSPFFNTEQINCKEINLASNMLGIEEDIEVKDTLQQLLQKDDSKENVLISNGNFIGNTKSENWTCPLCNYCFLESEQNSHFVRCVETFQSEADLERESSEFKLFICDICKEDLSCLNVDERSIHMNRCIDKQTSEANFSTITPAIGNPALSITECPLCLKNFATSELRSTHVKKCSKTLGISIQDTITALQLQERHVLERISLGLPLPAAKSTPVKTTEKQTKKFILPKTKAASDIQLAKALSLSLNEEEIKKQELITSFENATNLSSQSFIASLKPPKEGQVPGNKIIRKRKNINKPVPQLLVRTEEERKKILQEKVSTIITPEYFNKDADESKSVPENKSVPTDLDLSVTESHVLWNLAGKADKKTFYYIKNLQEWITTSEISAGSKLLNLSQIPGHHIYTQKSCDYTFTSQSNSDLKSSQEKSSNSVPSTQEMMDLMMIDSTQNMNQNDTALLNCSPEESMTICDTMNYTNMQDGFFVEIQKTDSMVGSDAVINSLQTLVGSSWMSDVDILVSDEKVIPAHKLLLMLRCPALQGILNVSCDDKKCTLNWKDISFDAALKFLNFLYTGTDCRSETDIDIYHLAIRYGISDLQKSLRNKVIKCNDEPHDPDETREMAVSSNCLEDNIEIPMEVVVCSDEGLSISDLNQIEGQSVTSKAQAEIIDNAHQNITDSTNVNLIKSASSYDSQSNAEISDSNTNSVNHLITKLSENVNVSSSLEKFNESSTSLQQKESDGYGDQFTCFKPDVYNIHNKKQRSYSPDIFECNSDDELVEIDSMQCYAAKPQTNSLISDSIFNNTTLPIIPGVNRNNIITEETTRFDEQTVSEPCFNFSNEVTIIHESPRAQSCTPRKCSPFKNNGRFESHSDISDTLLKKKSDSNKFGLISDIVGINRNMKFVNQKISPVLRDREEKPETIDNNELGDVCVLDDSRKPSSLVSPVKNKIQSCKQLISPESHESASSPNKYIKKESFNDITSPKCLSQSSQQTVLKCLDFGDKEEIYISDHSSPSPSPTERNPENNSKYPISTPALNNCTSDIHSSPISNKFVENKIHPPELNPQLTPMKLNFEIDPKLTMSPTSLKCALAAEQRRNLSSIIENSQNSLTESEHPGTDQAPLTNDHNLPVIQEIYQDESSNETVKIATNGTYSPVYLTSDDDEDACEQDTEHLPEVFDNVRNSPCPEISLITANEDKMKDLSPKNALHAPVSLPKCSKTASATLKRKDLQRVKSLSSATATLCIDLDENSSDYMECLPNSQLCQAEKSDFLNQEISNKDTCFEVLKKVKKTPVSKKDGIPIYTISDSPITPLPDYQNMQTPQIKMALKKYGIRPLPRKKAVTILTHIYDETHPWFEDGTEISSSQVVSSASTSSAAASQKETKKRKIVSKAISQNTVETSKKSKKVTQQSKQIPGSSSQTRIKPNDESVQIECLSQESPEEHYLSQSPNSSKSDDNDFPEESLLHLPDSNENEEIGSDDKIRERIQQYILSNKVLYTKILQYEPLNLTEFHDELKDNKVKIAVAKLMNFLDEQCITFTFPRKEEYRKKQQSRQQKFRKKMIAKLSQPSSEN